MTDITEAREAIYQAFNTAWAAETPLAFDNDGFDPADGVAEWVRLSVRHRLAGQETLGSPGNRRFYRQGAAMVQVFVQPNTGTLRAGQLVRKAMRAFEGSSLAGTTVRFGSVIPREIGNDTEGWYQFQVEAEFEYDETR